MVTMSLCEVVRKKLKWIKTLTCLEERIKLFVLEGIWERIGKGLASPMNG